MPILSCLVGHLRKTRLRPLETVTFVNMSAKPHVIDTTWTFCEPLAAHRNSGEEKRKTVTHEKKDERTTPKSRDNLVMRFAGRLGPLLLQTDTQEVVGSATVCYIPEERRNNLATLVRRSTKETRRSKLHFLFVKPQPYHARTRRACAIAQVCMPN